MSALGEAWDDLEQHLIGDEAELPEVLGDLDHVERTLRAIAWRRRKIAQAEQVAQAVIERAQEHVAAERKRFDPAFLEDRLRAYHRARLADDPKAKTLRFPSGELTARKQPERWDIDDETFLAWAQRTGRAEFVRTKVEVDRQAAKRRLSVKDGIVVTDDAELVPGVSVTPGDIALTVKTGDDA